MRKSNLIVPVFIIFALALAACSSGGTSTPTPTPGTTAPGQGTTPGATLGGGPAPATAAATATTAGLPGTGATGTPVSGGAAGTPAPGMTGTPSATSTAGLPATGGLDVNRMTTLFTLPVIGQDGEQVGFAHDVVLNLCTAAIDYVAVAPGASSGTASGNWILIPWSDLTLQSSGALPSTGATGTPAAGMTGTPSTFTNGSPTTSVTASATITTGLGAFSNATALVLNDPISKVNGAPTFIPGALPNMNNPGWDTNLRSYWGTNPPTCPSAALPSTGATGTPGAMTTEMPTAVMTTGTPAPTSSLPGGASTTSFPNLNLVVLGRNLLGSTVQSNDGSNLGQVSDVILDVHTGAIQYLIVSASSELNMGEKLIVVPLGAFKQATMGAAAMSSAGTPPAAMNATAAATASMTGTPQGTSTPVTVRVLLVVNVNRATFLQAPAFDFTGMPNTMVSGWDSQITSFWSQ